MNITTELSNLVTAAIESEHGWSQVEINGHVVRVDVFMTSSRGGRVNTNKQQRKDWKVDGKRVKFEQIEAALN